MSETDSDGAAAHAYFRAIEEVFIRLRGAPLMLSPEDWRVARTWHDAGIPLGIVEDTLEELFGRRREREAKGRVNSLRYCGPAVEAAWQTLRELRGPGPVVGEPEERRPKEILDRIAEALPESLTGREQWATRIRSLSGGPARIDEGLRELELEILEAVHAALDSAALEQLEAGVDTACTRLASRLGPTEDKVVRAQLRRQRLREIAGLPRLTIL